MHAAEFIPLADLLLHGGRSPARDVCERESAIAHANAREREDAHSDERERTNDDGDLGQATAVPDAERAKASAAALRDARLFRARLADAFDDALAGLLREIAARVLARELRMAPCELATLVRQVLESAPCVRVRVATEDASLDIGIPVVVDAALEAGDAVVELAGGELDVRLGVRLANVLESLA